MSTSAFDTLKFANRLKAAGISGEFAEAQADALSEVLETRTGNLVTNNDLEKIEARIEKSQLVTKNELERLETSLNAKIEKSGHTTRNEIEKLDLRIRGEMNLVRWMFGVIVTGIASLVLKDFFQ
jgi:hypothetical protein